jgi:hypothetical protein
MPDPLAKPRPGDPFQPSAAQTSLFIDAARYARSRGIISGGDGPGANLADSAVIVTVKNSSGANVDQFGVLGIDTALITPTENQDLFKSRVMLSGVTPAIATHFDSFVITAEPIASGLNGRAFASGIFPAKVNVVDANDSWATVTATTDKMQSASAGAAKILFKESGTGDKFVFLSLSLPLSRSVLVKVTGDCTGGGKYNGRILSTGAASPDLTTTLAEADFGTVPSADNCYVLNSAEVGQSTHDLTSGTPITKVFVGSITGYLHTDGKPFIRINGNDWKACT